jgi:hypothetical protein
MDKKVLVVYYSQSGQLQEIVTQFAKPFQAAGVQVDLVRYTPKQDFPFPWTSDLFFDAMPESVDAVPLLLNEIHFPEQSYDLVVLAYQPWFLSPSIPTTSLLVLPEFLKRIKGTPVVTLIGSRNMWLNAQDKVRQSLKDAGAVLQGNIALFDRNNNNVSAVTILYWMLTGKKDRYLGVFPKPGVSEVDIVKTSLYGEVVLKHMLANDLETLQKDLVEKKAVEVDSDLMFIEQRAGKLFKIWSAIIKKRKNRAAWLIVFKYYLLIALFVVAPIVLLVNKLLFRPFLGGAIRRKKEHYLGLI